jgi:hypothetical protein
LAVGFGPPPPPPPPNPPFKQENLLKTVEMAGNFELKAGLGVGEGRGTRFGEVELVLPKGRKFGDIIFLKG